MVFALEEAKFPETGRPLFKAETGRTNATTLTREETMGYGGGAFRRVSTFKRRAPGIAPRGPIDISVSKFMEHQPDHQPPRHTEHQFIGSNKTYPEELLKSFHGRASLSGYTVSNLTPHSRWARFVNFLSVCEVNKRELQ